MPAHWSARALTILAARVLLNEKLQAFGQSPQTASPSVPSVEVAFANRTQRSTRMMRRFPIAVRVFTVASIAASPAIASATTTLVPAGGNLQEALTNAKPGDTILLEPGATYVGNFTLPVKPGAVF